MNSSKKNVNVWQSISTKLVLLLFLFGLIPLGAVSVMIWDTGNKLNEKVGKKFELVAKNIANTIDRNMFERYGDVQTISINESFLRRMYWYDRSGDNIIQQTMNTLVKKSGIYDLMIMVDLEGQVIAVNNQDTNGKQLNTQFIYDQNYATAPWFQRLQQKEFTTTQPYAAPGNDRLTGTVVEDVHIDHDVKRAYPSVDGLALGFSAPVYEDGEVVAYWTNLAPFSIIEDIIVQAYRELKDDGFPGSELTLLQGNGIILMDYDPTRDGSESIIHDLQAVVLKLNLVESGVQIAQQAVAGQSGNLEAMHARKKILQKGGYTHLNGFQGFSGMNWAVLVRAPSSTATFERDINLNRIWLAALIVLGILLPVGILIGRRAAGRIATLEIVAQQMAMGDIDTRFSATENDELGNLGQALNRLQEKSQNVVKKAHSIAKGNFIDDVSIRGEQDTLGQALQTMVLSLREIADMAQHVSQGDFSQRIDQKGEHDLLGQAMNHMVDHLQELAIQVDTVAEGNYTVEIVPQSEEDILGQAFSRMVVQIRERNQQIQESEARSQGIVNTANDGIVVITECGIVQLFNRAAVRLFGYEANEVIGENVKMLMPNPFHQEHDGYLSNYVTTGKGSIIGVGREVIGKRKDGKTFPVFLSLSEMNLPSGRLFSGILRDLTEENILKETVQENNRQMEQEGWLKTAVGTVSELSQGASSLQKVCHDVIAALAKVLDAGCGVIYIIDVTDQDLPTSQVHALQLMGSYAYQTRKTISTRVEVGEGLVGQCAFEKETILLTNVPSEYVTIQSGLGEHAPKQVIVTPVLYEGAVVGVIELATFQEFTDIQRELLHKVAENFGVTLHSLLGRQQTERLLEQSQGLTLELSAQKEELRTTNEELHGKAQELQRSEVELRQQSDELQMSNEELQVKSQSLEIQNTEIERKNEAIELAKLDLEKKAQDLAQASRYKSEFLANMSHELRTPLNSLLILAENLTDNEEGNLTDEQIESARVIHSGGKDLLHLINDILDLSKVEAGKLTVNMESVKIDDVCGRLHSLAAPLAKNKGNTWAIDRASDVPSVMITDQQRLEQIIKNLLSNAFKFTSKGAVTLRIHRMDQGMTLHQAKLQANSTIVFSVVDTGMGIPAEKQAAIFEAFQQADGSTSRNYGGTGLGLTISRELTAMLGGEIQLVSEAGKGSTFSLYLPCEYSEAGSSSSVSSANVGQANLRPQAIRQPSESNPSCGQDGERLNLPHPDTLVANHLLIIEDDLVFGKILQQYGMKQGYVCSWAQTGQEGLQLAASVGPSAILMDMTLPDLSGEELLEALKNNPATRHIPVHVISGRDNLGATLTKGAVGYLTKPVDGDVLRETIQKISLSQGKALLNVLLVEDDPIIQQATRQMIEQQGGATVVVVDTVQAAMDSLRDAPCDLLITDLRLPDRSGLELLRALSDEKDGALPPAIVYTGKDLTREEHQELLEYAACVVVKGGLAPERLMEEVGGLFQSIPMTETVSESATQRAPIEAFVVKNSSWLTGRTVLVVDDDFRNVFALSKVLKRSGAAVLIADTGALALEKLETEPTVDVILLDIMMPEMDGYETTRRIRQHPTYADVPIVILSAKTMPDEEAKCLEVGANAYLSKPVDLQQLYTLMASALAQPLKESV